MPYLSEGNRQQQSVLIKGFFLFLLTLMSGVTTAEATSACRHGDRYILGNREMTNQVDHYAVNLTTLIDSGSTLSSMDARDIEIKTHTNGSRWVYFDIPRDDDQAQMLRLVKPLKRYAWIQTHSGKPTKRPVIETAITLGPITTKTAFSLTERSAFNEKILLGKNTLDGMALIDPSNDFLLNHDCL